MRDDNAVMESNNMQIIICVAKFRLHKVQINQYQSINVTFDIVYCMLHE